MLAALLIVFREVFEAGLIVGIILAATEGVRDHYRWVGLGVLAGALGAGVVALFARQMSEAFAGVGQQLFNAAVLLAAAIMLSWHVLWMASHGRVMARDMKQLGASVIAGERTMLAMALVVAAAVLREGIEVALFLFGIAAAGGGSPQAMLFGGVLGLSGGALVSWALYRGLLVIPTQRLFSITNVLLCFLAAGMSGQAVVDLVNAGLLPALGTQLWDTSFVLADDSIPGRALHAMLGYSDRPMGLQVGVYLTVLVLLIAFSRRLKGGALKSKPPHRG